MIIPYLLEIGENDRPEHPQKIIDAEILLNPFDDIVLREATVEPKKKKRKKKKPKK